MVDLEHARIFVAGHKGMVGSAILRALEKHGARNILVRGFEELDLTVQPEVTRFLTSQRPDHVVIAAARVGGIHANETYPAEFIYENLMIEANLIRGAYLAGCRNLLFLGSSCIYPREATQPIVEGELLNGHLESTNEPYAVAKIAGIKLCESFNRQYGTDYRSLMPTNLYGPGDNFHAKDSHVIPGLMRRLHEAKEKGLDQVTIWGTGRARREFLHVDDLARACAHVLQLPRERLAEVTTPRMSHINVGTGVDVTIGELAELLAEVVGFEGTLTYDSTKPDGTPRKLLDVTRIHTLGWKPTIPLDEGLRSTYGWFLENIDHIRS